MVGCCSNKNSIFPESVDPLEAAYIWRSSDCSSRRSNSELDLRLSDCNRKFKQKRVNFNEFRTATGVQIRFRLCMKADEQLAIDLGLL